MKKSFIFCFTTFVLILLHCTGNISKSAFIYIPVFQRNDGVYPEYRIPALLATQNGTLLACAEGRQTLDDHAQNDIVLKRSVDGGQSWSATQVVYSDGANVAVNPCIVQLPDGRILLMFQRFPAGYHSRPMQQGRIKLLHPGVEGELICRTLLMFSDDDGLTWSEPRDVTAGTKRPTIVNSTASGPGVGIVLTRGDHKGRIIIPTNEGMWDGHLHRFNVYTCFSDDNGETWQFGENAPHDDAYGNEVQMVELIDGSVLLNSRSIYGSKLRKLAISRDGGETWTQLKDQPDLPEPQCMGSTIRYSWPEEEGGSVLLYSGPASQNKREQGTIFISRDEGQTWPECKLVYPGEFAYSCLTKLPDGSVGLLFEADGYAAIRFVHLSREWFVREKE